MRFSLEIHIEFYPHNLAKSLSEFCGPCLLPTLPTSSTPSLSSSNLFAAAAGSM